MTGSSAERRQKFQAMFQRVAGERLSVIRGGLEQLRHDPRSAAEAEGLLREVHTLKGEALLLELEEIHGRIARLEQGLVRAAEQEWSLVREHWEHLGEELRQLAERVASGASDAE